MGGTDAALTGQLLALKWTGRRVSEGRADGTWLLAVQRQIVTCAKKEAWGIRHKDEWVRGLGRSFWRVTFLRRKDEQG